MTPALIYKLIGYDRKTEELAVEYVIPSASVERVKVIAGIARRPEFVGDCPLSEGRAREIAALIGVRLDRGRNWFLEPSALAPIAEQATD
jgi:hypothetical protein